MEDYQSENDSICLNRAKRYGAIMPEKSIIFIPGQSLLLGGLLSRCETEQGFLWWPPDEFYSAYFELDLGVFTAWSDFTCCHCHF